jgi:nickel superoxide dismutase
MKRLSSIALMTALLFVTPGVVDAHCQIPCGIYDDELRVQLIEEHIGTIEKSMKQIVALGEEQPINHNQVVRWVNNKERHAQEIQDIVTAYFMAQRVKPTPSSEQEAHAEYVGQLTLLHHIQVTAMKAKQTTDQDHVKHLRIYVEEFRKAYFGDEGGHSH